MTDSMRLPVQTEYRGVVFRSKSEAILARAFDLCGLSWVYEPPELTQGDLWRPDFWIVSTSTDRPGFKNLVVEYKPRQPTQAVFDRLYDERFPEVLKVLPFAICYL